MSVLLLPGLILLGSFAQAAAPTLLEQFTLQDVLSMPESAVIDEQNEFVYVSNVNVYAKDGNGFISRVRTDGTDLNLQWLTGLDSPTGLAIHDGRLFFADYDQLLEVDIASAQIINRYPSPDENPALNDVAIAADGSVYVSGSGSRSIYVLNAGELQVWIQDRGLLEFANGLLVLDDLLVHGGASWTVFNRETRQATDLLTNVNESLNNIDGITEDVCGGFLVTTVASGELWWVSAEGQVNALDLGFVDGIDLFRRGELLAVPRVPDSLSVYRLDQNC
ncbi:MAG: hypothetical protein RL839_05265 [Gammaproteobacteria bacterium]